MCMTAQFFVHGSIGSRFLMIIKVGKIWMQTISKARRLLKWRIDFSNLLRARPARTSPILPIFTIREIRFPTLLALLYCYRSLRGIEHVAIFAIKIIKLFD